MTVYGNIDAESLPENLSETKEITTGTPLGISGNSAWQQGHSSLEFQVIDTKNSKHFYHLTQSSASTSWMKSVSR